LNVGVGPGRAGGPDATYLALASMMLDLVVVNDQLGNCVR
jgi:hypothetical protein